MFYFSILYNALHCCAMLGNDSHWCARLCNAMQCFVTLLRRMWISREWMPGHSRDTNSPEMNARTLPGWSFPGNECPDPPGYDFPGNEERTRRGGLIAWKWILGHSGDTHFLEMSAWTLPGYEFPGNDCPYTPRDANWLKMNARTLPGCLFPGN